MPAAGLLCCALSSCSFVPPEPAKPLWFHLFVFVSGNYGFGIGKPSILGACRRCRRAPSACVRTFVAGRVTTAAMPQDTQSLKSKQQTFAYACCCVFVSCAERGLIYGRFYDRNKSSESTFPRGRFVLSAFLCFVGLHLPALLGRIRTELIPENTLRSRLLSCNHNISSLVYFCAPVAYPGLSTLLSTNFVFWSIWSLSQMQASSICLCSNFCGRPRYYRCHASGYTISKKQATNIRLCLLLCVRIMCRERFDLWAFL